MAEKIIIMGESGTGKSTSLRNCDPAVTAVVNPVGKPLPFKGARKFDTLNGKTDSKVIIDWIKNQVKAGKKMIIIDDFQYILSVPYMNRIHEAGWDKWNDFGANYFELIDVCNDLPEDVCVYYMTHTETLENGLTTIKLIGKLLREKITIEGLFTIVLRTQVSEGKYFFLTQNSGTDTVKSPMGMFPSYAVENDLKYIDDKIRNYYEFDDAKSDAEIAKADEEAAATEIEKPAPKTSRRARRHEVQAENMIKAVEEDLKEDPREEIPFDEAPEHTYAAESKSEEKFMNIPDEPAVEELPQRKERPEMSAEEASATEVPVEEAPRRRRRRE